ncbi:MAG TPA: AMP-binding protein [Solirubrobacteraceae bacterium]|nr:AMP-binding protein [Solirubrobacteraceae bacterium]
MSDGPVIRIGDRVIAQDALRRDAARVAAGLLALGVEHGERVAIVMRNEPEYLLLSAACGLIGVVPVPVNWHWRGAELAHVLTDSSARVVFAHSNFVGAVTEVLPGGVTLVEVPVGPELQAAYGAAPISGEHQLLAEFIASHEPYAEPQERAPVGLIYTSGTTGLPKGVMREAMAPEQSLQVAGATLGAMGLRPGMSTLVTAPLYHSAPSAQGSFALALGIDLTIMPRFDGEEFLRVIENHAINHAQVVPTMFVRLLELPPEVRARYDLRSLQCVVHAAAPCPAHVKQRMIEWMGPVISEYYGGTEIGIVVACDAEEWLAHPGTVGAPVGGADIHVFDPEGRLLPRGETGEVYIKPPDYWPDFTYLGLDERRREIDRDGYLSIGDVGRIDADGFLYLSDRARDMVISGGVNIYPIEIEACLLELPGVRDVAVFGVPDDSYGEALAAHVDADPAVGLTEDDIRDHIRARMAGYKVPRTVVFDDHLPREESGKIFKRRIREHYWREAGRSI